MSETYDIMFADSPVGKAQVEKQGLYYAFSCRCRLPDEGIYRIHAIYADKREDLGICVPIGEMFGMDKKISAKHLGDGTPDFELLPKDWKPRENVPMQESEPDIYEEEQPISEEMIPDEPEEELFLPVSEEEPFAYLTRLDNAVMEVREEQVGILFPKQE